MRTISNYDFVYMTTHGAVDSKHRGSNIKIMTGERINPTNILKVKQEGLTLFSPPDQPYDYPVPFFGLNANFFNKFTYQNSFMYMNACNSLKNDSLANAFTDNGASVYMGWDEETSTYLAKIYNSDFFRELSEPNKTLKEAFDATIAKHNPAEVFDDTNNDGSGCILTLDQKNEGGTCPDTKFDHFLNLKYQGGTRADGYILNPSDTTPPSLLIDGGTTSTKQQGGTYVTTGSNFTPNSTVTRYLRQPNGTTITLTPTLSANSSGNISWSYTSVCTTAVGSYTIWVVDDATGRRSNDVTEVVTANSSCNCPSGNGLYCGNSSLGQNTGYLYQCTNGSYTLSQQCSYGCQVNAPGTNDSCKAAPNPTIAMSPMSGPGGTVFVEWGTGFTPNSTATLYFPKYDGINNGSTQVSIDATGHFEITYPSGTNKPPGNYRWYAIDGPTGIKSNEVTFTITVNPTIAMSPMSGPPGTVFVEWGTGFTPNSTATLYFPKYDGINNGSTQVSIDATGHFEITYPSGSNKPKGSYSWYAIDGPTGKKSNTVTFVIN